MNPGRTFGAVAPKNAPEVGLFQNASLKKRSRLYLVLLISLYFATILSRLSSSHNSFRSERTS